ELLQTPYRPVRRSRNENGFRKDHSSKISCKLAGMLGARLSIFICYSREDEHWKDRLEHHLAPLVRQGLVRPWDLSSVAPGEDTRARVDAAIADARVAVFLLSADFNASDFVQDEELPAILRRNVQGGLVVLPIMVHAFDVGAVEW